ncbi:deaminase [Phytomonospora sp. NPDC050363]|uniref:dihydrofolate reductase family protein n=1 Tax=Phytomonospora sp. NPDC050363 TaxID=3155642 RepID=UPI00340CC180
MSMSLDGFIAGPEHRVDEVFSWYQNGDIELETNMAEFRFHVGEANARYLREAWGRIGAILAGRALFDITGGWGGTHPAGQPTVVYSREIPDGWENTEMMRFAPTLAEAAALAREIAGDKMVGTSGTRTVAGLLNEGLLDGIEVNLVPYLLGEGHRFFDGLKNTPIALTQPTVVEGEGVTHLRYDLRK